MALFIQSTGADEFMRAMNPPDLQGDTLVQYNLLKKKKHHISSLNPLFTLIYAINPS